MEELGTLSVIIILFTNPRQEGRIKRVKLLTRHSCTLSEAKTRLHEFLKNNTHLSPDYMEANWTVEPVSLIVREFVE